MACTNPVKAWQSRFLSESGRRMPTFKVGEAYLDLPKLELPCGKCLSCVAVRQRALAVRLMHEASQHEQNCFATFTFDQEHLPEEFLNAEFQKMMKRLRNRVLPLRLRHFGIGEYGEKSGRPHFHALLFGSDFLAGAYSNSMFDGEKLAPRPEQVYRSPLLEEAWGGGGVEVGTVTVRSAMYVAGYCLKKIGSNPLRAMQSKFIGRGWLEKYRSDILSAGCVIIKGQKLPIPHNYFEWFPEELEPLKQVRLEFAQKQARRPAGQRLYEAEAKEAYLKSRMELKKAKVNI